MSYLQHTQQCLILFDFDWHDLPEEALCRLRADTSADEQVAATNVTQPTHKRQTIGEETSNTEEREREREERQRCCTCNLETRCWNDVNHGFC